MTELLGAWTLQDFQTSRVHELPLVTMEPCGFWYDSLACYRWTKRLAGCLCLTTSCLRKRRGESILSF